MKQLFGINVTENKKNTKSDGEVLINKQHQGEIETKIDEVLREQNAYFTKKRKLILPINIIRQILIAFVIIIGISFLGASLDPEAGFAVAYANGGFLLYIGGGVLIIGVTLLIIEKILIRNANNSPEFQHYNETLIALIEAAQANLDFPSDAVEIDMFSYRYRITKKGKVQFRTLYSFGSQADVPVLNQYTCYRIDNDLCISDLFSEYRFAISEIESIDMVNIATISRGWNKQEAPNSPTYAPFKINFNQQGNLIFKPLYSLKINSPVHGHFELYFPRHELQAITTLTGLYVSEESLRK